MQTNISNDRRRIIMVLRGFLIFRKKIFLIIIYNVRNDLPVQLKYIAYPGWSNSFETMGLHMYSKYAFVLLKKQFSIKVCHVRVKTKPLSCLEIFNNCLFSLSNCVKYNVKEMLKEIIPMFFTKPRAIFNSILFHIRCRGN